MFLRANTTHQYKTLPLQASTTRQLLLRASTIHKHKNNRYQVLYHYKFY